VVELSVGIGDRDYKCDATALEGMLPADLVLGKDFLSKERATICFEEQKLVLGDNEVPVSVQTNGVIGTIGQEMTSPTTGTDDPVSGNDLQGGNMVDPSDDGEWWQPPATQEATRKDILRKVDEAEGNERERTDMRVLLLGWEDIFTLSKNPGQSEQLEHKIEVERSNPIVCRPRRQSPKERDIEESAVTDMLQAGVIEPSSSPWSFRSVLIKKRDNTLRFCVDFRPLNAITVRDQYPLPRIDETLDRLSGAQYFSSLDLASGYWQIRLREKDKPLTAFSTSSGHYQFRVMPFGLSNAPATFQRSMDTVLADVKGKACLVYMDDIMVFAITALQYGVHNENARATHDFFYAKMTRQKLFCMTGCI
jgi:hypothetical protein